MMEPEIRPCSRREWLLVGLLVMLVLPLRLWLWHNTEVTARDSIGYIRYALRFEHEPWQWVLQSSDQHPGYPVLIWLASLPIRALDGATTPENMQQSAQAVSFIASLLLIVPMYFLGRQFFGRGTSFWATLLFQYLPISAQLLSDGISEPAYLVLLTSALLQAVHAVRSRSIWRCGLCGLFAGAAYLIRPEGLLVLPAFALVMSVMQSRASLRSSWTRFFASAMITASAAILIGSVYVLATGRITNKVSALEILHNLSHQILRLRESFFAGEGHLLLFAKSFAKVDNKAYQLGHSFWALLSEINQGFHYLATIPALLGGWWAYTKLRRQAGYWLLVTFCLLHSFILVSLAMSVSYVSERHVLILVLIGCYFVVFGLQELARQLLKWAAIAPSANGNVAWSQTWWRSASLWFVVGWLALVGFGLPKATQRLHGMRVGNHQAGLWLAGKLQTGDIVLDDHNWSHYFAGLVFREKEVPILPADFTPKCYVVITRSRDPQIDQQRQAGVLAGNAEVVYAWPEKTALEQARVVIYVQPRDYEKNRWHKASYQDEAQE